MERKTKPTMHPHTPCRKHAFGNAVSTTASQSGAVTTDLGYTGQRQEPELGLYYYNARWYDPVLGRFAQADTIVPNPVDAKAFDRYAYVYNNPVRYNDPSGHCIDSSGAETGQGGTGYRCDGSGYVPIFSELVQSTDDSIEHQLMIDAENELIMNEFLFPPVTNLTVGGFRHGEPTPYSSAHIGTDWSYYANEDTPYIHAEAYGVVVAVDTCSHCNNQGISTETNNGYGNMVLVEYPYHALPPKVQADKDLNIKKGESLYVLYAHMEGDPYVETGQYVSPGQILGKIGASGNSDGRHLHQEMVVAPSDNIPFSDEYCPVSTCRPSDYNSPHEAYYNYRNGTGNTRDPEAVYQR
jgi:RHS repeat-associated protein